MASKASLTILFCFFSLFAIVQSTEFIFHGFNASETKLIREGASVLKNTGALRLTNKSHDVQGQAFYYQAIEMLDNGNYSSPPTASSFCTSFVFAIDPSSSEQGGYGLAFTLSPSPSFPGAEAGQYLGIFNPANDGDDNNHIFAVEFDTVNGHNGEGDKEGNHVGININGLFSNDVEPAAYFVNDIKEDFSLEGDTPVHAWIDYDGVQKMVNVTICPVGKEKPTKPLISKYVEDLTSVVKEKMYVGFSASTGRKSSSHYILGWSFSTHGAAPALNISILPPAPVEKSSNSLNFRRYGLIVALSVVAVLLLASLVTLTLHRRMMQCETLEKWELDCPHRFNYSDLHTATKGFKESELIGLGGFGAVYKGVLPKTGTKVAVKRITGSSVQGMRGFAAEIESLGRLRHKHLVNLQGWCKQKNNLILVYDYIRNGSLDTLLFNRRHNFVLSWEQRFAIIKGIGAGLLYLHEEWEKVVIHRDVKSSNVLIDAEMNARLSDFGLARLYDHGTAAHSTCVVGTIGYIAPELARNGKASTCTDVFAFGVLLLEIASGRRPTGSGDFYLVEWVLECRQMNRILDAADPKLNSNYVVEEMELILNLGLLCAHQRPDSRPNMRRVMQYLNSDDRLPVVDNWGSSINSQSISEINLRLPAGNSTDAILRSYRSSSIGGISSSFISIGR